MSSRHLAVGMLIGALLWVAGDKLSRAASSDTAYLYEGDAAIMDLNVAPCTDAAVLANLQLWVRPYYHEGAAVTRSGEQIPFCWAKHAGDIAVVLRRGPLPFLHTSDPRLKRIDAAASRVADIPTV